MECNGLLWVFDAEASARFGGDLGFLPDMLNAADPRSAREQFDANYQWGGYWTADPQTKMAPSGALLHPGDPPLPWVAQAKLRDELIRVYPADFVAIVQTDGAFVLQRMD
jgi:hypothetical protein